MRQYTINALFQQRNKPCSQAWRGRLRGGSDSRTASWENRRNLNQEKRPGEESLGMPGKITEWASTSNVQRTLNASLLATAWHLGCEQSALTTSTRGHEDNILSLFSVYSLESLRLFSEITNTQPTLSIRRMTLEQFSSAKFRPCGWIDWKDTGLEVYFM